MAPTLMGVRRKDFTDSSYRGPVLRSMSKILKTLENRKSPTMTSKKSRRPATTTQAQVQKLFRPAGTKTRKPRRLTELRKRKILTFMSRNCSNPGYAYGELGSSQWISGLLKFMNSFGHPRHAVNPSDVCIWLKESYSFFHREFIKVALNDKSGLSNDSDSPLPGSSPALSIYSSASTNQRDSGVFDVSGASNTTFETETESDIPAVPATLPDLGKDPPNVGDNPVDEKKYYLYPGEPGQLMVVDDGVVVDILTAKQESADPAASPPTGADTQEALPRSKGELLQEIKGDTLQGIKEETLEEIKQEPVDPYLTEFQGGGNPMDLSQIKEELEKPNLTALVPVRPDVDNTYDFSYMDGIEGQERQMTDLVPYLGGEFSNGLLASTEQALANQPPSFDYTVSSDLENISADVKEMIQNINFFGDANSVLLRLADTGAFSPDVDNMQLFTNILTKLVDDAKHVGLYSDADIDTLCLATKIIGRTLGRMH